MYMQYITNTWFMREKEFDTLIKSYEFTNFHAQNRSKPNEEYEVKIRVKEVKDLLNIGGRRLNEFEIEGHNQTQSNDSDLNNSKSDQSLRNLE